MSLILDALKKSEAERQRGQLPNLLSPLPSAPSLTQAQKKSGLPWFILFALLSVTLVFGYFYTEIRATDSPGIVPAPVNQTPTPASTSAPLAIAPSVSVEMKPAPIERRISPAATNPSPAPVEPQASVELIEAPSIINETETTARIAALSEMPNDLRQQLPALKLSMHVYSAEASKRFAIIDGQRVNEGSMLGAAVVEQIRQDGVVLSVQAQSYLLPRP